MPLVTNILACVQVHDKAYSGTNGPLFLTLTGSAGDVFTSTWARSMPQDVDFIYDGRASVARLPAERRDDPNDEAYYYIYADLDPYAVEVETTAIVPTGIRLGIRADNLIRPRHIAIWGHTMLEEGRERLDAHEAPGMMLTAIPIALATDLVDVDLSGDNREGPQTMMVPAARPSRGRDTAISRLLVMVKLGLDRNAAPAAPVSIRVRRDSGLVVDATLGGFDILQPGQWKAWVIPRDEVTSFTRRDLERRDRLHQDTVTLHVLGENKAQIVGVVVFGLADTPAGEPQIVHPLVYTGLNIDQRFEAWVGGTESADQKLRLALANYML